MTPSTTRRTAADAADWFDAATLQRSRDYARPLKRVGRIASPVEGLLVLALLVSLTRIVSRSSWVAGTAEGIALLVVVGTVTSLPRSAWRSLSYDRGWGLSTTTTRQWVRDQVLGLVLGLVLGEALGLGAVAVVHATGLWWLVDALGVFAVSGLLAFLFPVVLLPLFNTLTPLEPGDLKDRIDRVAALAGVSVQGSFTMDASKRSSRDNAFVAGFGSTGRVVVFDTMLEHPPHVTEQVVAHEIGHYRQQHVLKALPVSFVSALLAFGVLELLSRWHGLLEVFGIDSVRDPGAVGFLALGAGVLLGAQGLVTAAHSRWRERQADLEALELLRDPGAFVDVWRRMGPKNVAVLEPTLMQRLLASHPPIAERMQFAQVWADDRGVPLVDPH